MFVRFLVWTVQIDNFLKLVLLNWNNYLYFERQTVLVLLFSLSFIHPLPGLCPQPSHSCCAWRTSQRDSGGFRHQSPQYQPENQCHMCRITWFNGCEWHPDGGHPNQPPSVRCPEQHRYLLQGCMSAPNMCVCVYAKYC